MRDDDMKGLVFEGDTSTELVRGLRRTWMLQLADTTRVPRE